MLARCEETKELLTSIQGSVTMMNTNLLGNSCLLDEWNEPESAIKWSWNVELCKWNTRKTRIKVHKV